MKKLVYKDEAKEFTDDRSLLEYSDDRRVNERLLPKEIWDGDKMVALNFAVAVYLHHMRSGQ